MALPANDRITTIAAWQHARSFICESGRRIATSKHVVAMWGGVVTPEVFPS